MVKKVSLKMVYKFCEFLSQSLILLHAKAMDIKFVDWIL